MATTPPVMCGRCRGASGRYGRAVRANADASFAGELEELARDLRRLRFYIEMLEGAQDASVAMTQRVRAQRANLAIGLAMQLAGDEHASWLLAQIDRALAADTKALELQRDGIATLLDVLGARVALIMSLLESAGGAPDPDGIRGGSDRGIHNGAHRALSRYLVKLLYLSDGLHGLHELVTPLLLPAASDDLILSGIPMPPGFFQGVGALEGAALGPLRSQTPTSASLVLPYLWRRARDWRTISWTDVRTLCRLDVPGVQAPGESGVRYVPSLAVTPNGLVAVTEQCQDNTVVIASLCGSVVRRFHVQRSGPQPQEPSWCAAVAATARGELWLALRDLRGAPGADMLVRVTDEGTVLEQVPMPDATGVSCMLVLPSGDVLLGCADRRAGRRVCMLRYFAALGKLEPFWYESGPRTWSDHPWTVGNPRGLALVSPTQVAVADKRMELSIHSLEDGRLLRATAYGRGGGNKQRGVAVTPDGFVVVLEENEQDFEGAMPAHSVGAKSLSIFAPDGTLVQTVHVPHEDHRKLMAVALAPDGRLLLTSTSGDLLML
jgi:hypothetical protein